MITRVGKVTITSEGIEADGFTFVGVNTDQATIEVMQWLMAQIKRFADQHMEARERQIILPP